MSDEPLDLNQALVPEGEYWGTIKSYNEAFPEGRDARVGFKIELDDGWGIVWWYIVNRPFPLMILKQLLRSYGMRQWRNLPGRRVKVKIIHEKWNGQHYARVARITGKE